MTLSEGFRRLATALENIESNGLQVLDVATTDDESDERLTVDLTVAVPLDGSGPATQIPLADGKGTTTADEDESASSARAKPDRRPEILDPLPVKTEAANGVSESSSATDGAADETTTAGSSGTESGADESEGSGDVVDCPIEDCDATFESEHGMKIHRTKTHCNQRADGGESTAPYRDPDRLREVYAACDSFSEMREALETDVSAQTVRRQMIAHDIYEPGESKAESDAATDGEDTRSDRETTNDSDDEQARETEAPELDDIELPDGMTVAALKTTVSEARTLYDVQQRFELDREQAMELLRAYDLLDVVHGRISDRDRRKQVDDAEIARRILEHAPVSQPPRA